jgi:glycosyltransferase involved in cell wall biosynthesis
MIKNKKKVAIVSSSFGGGGAERFAASLGFMLEKLDFEIYNIIINDTVKYQYCGHLLNLGKSEKKSFHFTNKIIKGILLNQYLNKNEIEIVIDNRARNQFIRDLIGKFIFGKRKTVYVIHSYNLKNYFPKSVFLAKMLYQSATKLICVSHAIEDEVNRKFKLKNTTTIYNSVAVTSNTQTEESSELGKFILFFGRLDNRSKNFNLMLDAFLISGIYNKGYHLKIMGNGPDLHFIQNKIRILHLDNFVKLEPFNSKPFKFVQAAKFTILTSRYEGFPMSVVESLALRTPVVSVDCNSGPREIINNEYNGLLVENNNPKAFAKAMNRMIDEPVLYDFCKSNSSKSVEHLSVTTISKQWEAIFI